MITVANVSSEKIAALYEIPRVLVQGDRDPEGPAREAATQLGSSLKSKGWGTTVGAYGGFVKVLEESGVSCICHETDIKDHGDVKFKASPALQCRPAALLAARAFACGTINTTVPDAQIRTWAMGESAPFDSALKEISWAIRLGVWMGMSQAFCFFAGREGTLAHLIPVLTYNIKGWAKSEGKHRKVVLLGWDTKDIDAICTLYKLNFGSIYWLAQFPLDRINDAVDFLTA